MYVLLRPGTHVSLLQSLRHQLPACVCPWQFRAAGPCRTAEEKAAQKQKRKEAADARRKKATEGKNGNEADRKRAMAFSILSKIIDPLRKALSCAVDMYFDGTLEGPKELDPV
jgi:hypothetical protein